MTKDKYLWLTLGLTIFAAAPLFYPGYFQTHSGFIPLWSIAQLKENILDFTWLPVLIPFAPWRSGGLLPYYLAALLPLSPLNAMKLISLIGILAGSSGLYLWLKSWIGAQGASVAALVYTYAPFTIATLYVRGAWSEAFFWGLLPWALLSATYLVGQGSRGEGEQERGGARERTAIRHVSRSFVIRALSFLIAVGFWAALGLSYLGLGVWAYLFMLAMLLGFHRPQALLSLIAGAVGLVIAVLLTLPKGAAGTAPVNLGDHLVYPAQLLSPFWDFGVSQAGWNDGLSLSLGLAAIGLTILSFTIWRGGPDRRPWFFVGVAAFVSLVVMPIGGWLWRMPGVDRLLIYPWQLLGFAVLGLAVMSGVSFWLDERLRKLPIYATILIIPLLAAYPNLEPQFITSPIPVEAENTFSGDDKILLLAHQFVAANPVEGTDLNPVEPYIPLAKSDPLSPGDTFYLQVRWQAVTRPAQDYKIFGHLVDADGQLITQIDVQPQSGERPTSAWLPGEHIEDLYTFTLPPKSRPPAQVWLGLYNGETLTRLPVQGDNEGRAMLDVK